MTTDALTAAVTNQGADCDGAAQAATDDLVHQLRREYTLFGERDKHIRIAQTCKNAADALERLAREIAELKRVLKVTRGDVMRELSRGAERDALRECVDAADARRKIVSRSNEHLWGAYDAARAKVKI